MSTVNPDWGVMFDEVFKRISGLEQRISIPTPVGQNIFETITIGPPGDQVTLVAPQAGITNLSVTTGSFFEVIFVDASWTAPTGDTTAEYEVEIAKKVGTSYELKQTRRLFSTSLRISNLEPETTYGVRVYAINRVNRYSVPYPSVGYQDVTTSKDASVPPAVSNISVARGATSIVVQFDPLVASQAPDVATGKGTYEVQISTNSNFSVVDREVVTTAYVVAFNDIETPEDFYARVRAIDASGNAGPWSVSATTATAGGVVDSMIVSGLNAAKITFGSMEGDRITANTIDANRLKTSELTAADIFLDGGSFQAGSPPANGLLINSQGIRLYAAGNISVALDALTGSGFFSGSISGSIIDGSTINGSEIFGTVISTSADVTDARTQIGGTAPGTFWTIPSQYNFDSIFWFTGHPWESAPAQVNVGTRVVGTGAGADGGYIQITSAMFDSTPEVGGGAWYGDTVASLELVSSPGNDLSDSDASLTATNVSLETAGAGHVRVNADDIVMNCLHSITLNSYNGQYILLQDAAVYIAAAGSTWMNFVTGGYTTMQIRKDGANRADLRIYNTGSSVDALMRISLGDGRVFYDTSSERYKSEVKDFSEQFTLNVIDDIRSIAYREEDGETKKLKPLTYMGFSAEQLYTVIPELVVLDGDQQPASVLYDKVTVLAIEAIKDLRQRVKDLESKLK